jgi:hypothetical protein
MARFLTSQNPHISRIDPFKAPLRFRTSAMVPITCIQKERIR